MVSATHQHESAIDTYICPLPLEFHHNIPSHPTPLGCLRALTFEK